MFLKDREPNTSVLLRISQCTTRFSMLWTFLALVKHQFQCAKICVTKNFHFKIVFSFNGSLIAFWCVSNLKLNKFTCQDYRNDQTSWELIDVYCRGWKFRIALNFLRQPRSESFQAKLSMFSRKLMFRFQCFRKAETTQSLKHYLCWC